MRRVSTIAALALLIGLVCAVSASAWEVEYNASTGVLPSAASPAWQLQTYMGITPAVSNGALRIQNSTDGGYTYYAREAYAIDAGVPVTMEARTYVAAASSGAPRLSIQTKGCFAYLSIYPDHLAAPDYSGAGWVTFSGDFTIFRTIRLAYDGNNRMYAWVDGQSAFSWGPGSSGQSGVNFGSYLGAGRYDSSWQYVRYSKQYLPVPEPSSLLALAGGLAGLGGMALRRRRG